MYAKIASKYMQTFCQATFKDPERMESTMFQGGMLDCFDIIDTGSHKYIPAERLNEELGLPQGGGVYNYVKFSDNSYLLLTCEGKTAYWSGKENEKAEWRSPLSTSLI